MQNIYKPNNNFLYVIFLWFVVTMAILMVNNDLSASNSRNIDEKNATRITARKMVYTHQNNQINFIDNVQVRTKDFRMKCDKLVVYLKNIQDSQSELKTDQGKKGKPDDRQDMGESNKQSMDINQNLDKVVAKKNVHITMDNRSAQSEKAVYLRKDNILILTGNVRLKEGQNRIKSETVRLYMDENKSEILSGNKDQVEALIFPSSNSSEIRQ